MADQPDGQPGHTGPDHNECDHAEPSARDEQNPRGLLFISDVQALRRADTVAFHSADGAGVIEAALAALARDHQRIYTAKEQTLFPGGTGRHRRRRIDVAADIAGFDTERRWHDHQLPGATATATIGGAQIHDVWRSVAAFLRVGDVVRLRWHAGTTTGTGQLAGGCLHRDELVIEVRRGTRLWTFLLDMAVGPSSTRMVTATARR